MDNVSLYTFNSVTSIIIDDASEQSNELNLNLQVTAVNT